VVRRDIGLTPEAGKIKDREARVVPVHLHLLDPGLVELVQAQGDGPLLLLLAVPTRV